MKKNIIGIVVLAALVLYGVYDFTGGNKEDGMIKTEDETKVSDEQSNPEEDSQEASQETAGSGEVETGIQEGNKAPDFQLTTLKGDTLKLSDLEGKKVLLNFWASWCPPCKAEMPHMQDFYTENKEQVEVVAVNLTSAESNKGNVQQFAKDYGLTFPIPYDENGEIGATYQAFTIPTSYWIDSNGLIQKKVVGPMSKDMMIKLAESIE
ncbi:redoxin domain-containing protein [Pseudalkalibacillus caeni]|uniref:Redoxin domain-containing protein n=1 Tax=Exobacillus caeni TaxID=2574798 RepID=A0A5R9F2V6_9BACL|nr:redoxin domain-containing protein [Pseudalkalibacillus caeni]TLS38012.1 redoxin domain-containing protein [Pseudalkalibacillus caeni]